MNSDQIIYVQLAEKIIEKQESLLGPIAIEQAEHVPGLKVNWAKRHVAIAGSGPTAINHLVAQYKAFFGQMSIETCKEAVAELARELPPGKLPKSLL